MAKTLPKKIRGSKFPDCFQELTEEFAKEVESSCRPALKKIEQIGIPPQVVVFMAMKAALGQLDYFSPEIKREFRNRRDEAVELSRRLKIIAKDIRDFSGGRPNATEVEAGVLAGYGKGLGKYLRQHGRKDHDQAISIIASSILTYKPQFVEWKALASVVEAAYLSGGRSLSGSRKTNPDYEKLLRRAAIADLQLTAQTSRKKAIA